MSLNPSFILPLKFVELNPTQVVQYLSRHMDDWHLYQRRNNWQQSARMYANQWLQSDSIVLQMTGNTGVPQIDVIDCKGTTYLTEAMIARQQNAYDPLTYIYESSTALAPLAPGNYYFKITSGTIVLISEPIEVCAEIYKPSFLLQYRHRKYYEGVIWETGIEMNLRVPGMIRLKKTAAKDTLYEDQNLAMTMIKSVPYRIMELMVGAGNMIPDYMLDTLPRVFGCSEVRADGRYYSKNEGFNFEASEEESNGYLFGARAEIREKFNRPYKIVNPPADANEEVTIMSMTDLKGFSDTSEAGSSNLVAFEDVS